MKFENLGMLCLMLLIYNNFSLKACNEEAVAHIAFIACANAVVEFIALQIIVVLAYATAVMPRIGKHVDKLELSLAVVQRIAHHVLIFYARHIQTNITTYYILLSKTL